MVHTFVFQIRLLVFVSFLRANLECTERTSVHSQGVSTVCTFSTEIFWSAHTLGLIQYFHPHKSLKNILKYLQHEKQKQTWRNFSHKVTLSCIQPSIFPGSISFHLYRSHLRVIYKILFIIFFSSSSNLHLPLGRVDWKDRSTQAASILAMQVLSQYTSNAHNH